MPAQSFCQAIKYVSVASMVPTDHCEMCSFLTNDCPSAAKRRPRSCAQSALKKRGEKRSCPPQMLAPEASTGISHRLRRRLQKIQLPQHLKTPGWLSRRTRGKCPIRPLALLGWRAPDNLCRRGASVLRSLHRAAGGKSPRGCPRGSRRNRP